MKTVYTHTTFGVRDPQPIQVITLTSESGKMRLTITLDELADYENRQLGHAGALDELYPVVIPDDCFGAILEDLGDDQILEEGYLIHE
jgi:hypothetical protein